MRTTGKVRILWSGNGFKSAPLNDEGRILIETIYNKTPLTQVVGENQPVDELVARMKRIADRHGISLSTCGMKEAPTLLLWKRAEKQARINIDFSILRNSIRELNEGRNLDTCFDLCSFGWKDADLDSRGCNGINKILRVEGMSVIVEVAGHKTFCDPTNDVTDVDEEMYSNAAQEIIMEAGEGEWTGDDWSMHFKEEIRVPVVHNGDTVDYASTACRIINKACKAILPHAKRWVEADKMMEALYQEIRVKTDVR